MTAPSCKNRYKREPCQPNTRKMPRRIVINTKYGGFSLSGEAQNLFRELTKDIERPTDWFVDENVKRDDPFLLQVVDTLGLKASSGTFSHLGIAEIPDDIPEDGWIIQEYDGAEWVAENHRTWHAREQAPAQHPPPETPKNKPDSPCPPAIAGRISQPRTLDTRPSSKRRPSWSTGPPRIPRSPRPRPAIRSRMSRPSTPGTVGGFRRSENRVN